MTKQIDFSEVGIGVDSDRKYSVGDVFLLRPSKGGLDPELVILSVLPFEGMDPSIAVPVTLISLYGGIPAARALDLEYPYKATDETIKQILGNVLNEYTYELVDIEIKVKKGSNNEE